jgi:hypothetical protein
VCGHHLHDLWLVDHAIRRNLDHTPKPSQSRQAESAAIPPSIREQVSFTSHKRRLNLTTNHDTEPQLNSYPASEQRISDVERGLVCNAILPMSPAKTPSVGDSILFTLAYLDASEKTCYVQNGDSVCVSLTEVTNLESTDPATGQALFRFSWKPLGQSGSPGTIAKRVVKSRIAHRTGEPVGPARDTTE